MSKDNGIIITLFGPDGCGKSTIADLLDEYWNNAGVETKRMHWRPGILPYRCKDSIAHKKNFSDPCSTKVRCGVKSWLIFLYITVDFLLGIIFVIRKKQKNGINIIYERYYYDLLIDQSRYGLSIPASARRFFAKIIIPSPDIIILLDGSADVLYARKPELSCKEIESQRKRMKNELCGFTNCHVVNVEQDSPNTITGIILNKIKSQND